MQKLLIYILFILLEVNTLGQTTNIDSLQEIVQNMPDDEKKIALLYQFGLEVEHYSLQKAQNFYREGYQLSIKLKNDSLKAVGLHNMAIIYINKQQFDYSMQLHRKSLAIFQQLKDSINIAKVYKSLGSIYFYRNMYDSCLYYELQAMEILKNSKEVTELVFNYIALTAIYSDLGFFERAKLYQKRALKLILTTNRKDYEFISYNNMGMIFLQEKNTDSALYWFNKAYFTAKTKQLNIYLGETFYNIGEVYRLRGKYKIAINYYLKAINENDEKKLQLFAIYTSLAESYLLLNNLGMANASIRRAEDLLKIFKKDISNDDYIHFLKVKANLYEKFGNWEMANKLLNERAKFADSVNTALRNQIISLLGIEYQINVQDKIISELERINKEKQNLIKRNEIQKQQLKRITFSLAFVLLILLLTLSTIWQKNRKNKFLNKELQDKNTRLYETQIKLNRILNLLPEIFFEANYRGEIIFVNNNFWHISGYKKEDIKKCLSIWQFIHKKDKNNIKQIIRKLAKNYGTETAEFRFIKKDGTYFWAFISLSLKEIEGQQEYYGTVMDITKLKTVQKDLNLLMTAVSQSDAPLIITNSKPEIVFSNPAYQRITGYTKDELLGKNPSIVKSNLTTDNTYEILWHTITQGKIWRGVFINRRKSGEIYWDETIITPIKNSEGEITHYIANKEDITEKVKQDETIRKLFTATENSPNSVMILDNKARITYVNKAFEKITGYNFKEVKGKDPSFLNSDKHSQIFYNEMRKTIFSGKVWQGTLVNINKNGEYYWDASTIIPIKDDNNKLLGFVCNDIDITNRIKTEQELVDTMELLDIKNREILSSIKYAERIQNALISKESDLKTFFHDSFLIFEPRDIISGDFFWLANQQNLIFVAVVDCTGHSVPGAFMSILGTNLLDAAINDKMISNPADILEYMSKKLKNILNNHNYSNNLKDDMEVALAVIDTDKRTINFASSRNRLYVISDNKADVGIILLQNNNKILYKINGDREFLAQKNSDKKFSEHSFKYKENDQIYISTDGFYDQFDKENSKKFKRHNFEKLLFDISVLPMEEQKQVLVKTFAEFKGNSEQTDDVTVVGIKL